MIKKETLDGIRIIAADLDGTLLETERIAYSRYSKRDKVVAVRAWNDPADPDD